MEKNIENNLVDRYRCKYRFHLRARSEWEFLKTWSGGTGECFACEPKRKVFSKSRGS